MRTVVAKKSYYEIRETLGVGLTSEVYKAFRRDGGGWTKQEVALKVIKSKNDVQVLKKEFERLSQIRSKYCVRVLAWENLENGHALVLEYINGVTLHKLMVSNMLHSENVIEVLTQVRLGLQTLHRNKVFHGDLNLKNIMISREGVVKIIDFGFENGPGTQFYTPQFASPDRKNGASASKESDLYSLEKISLHLLNEVKERKRVASDWKNQIPRGARRRRLASDVQTCLLQTSLTTRKHSLKVVKTESPTLTRFSISAAAFVLMLVSSSFWQRPPEFVELNVRSPFWFTYSINGLPYQYGPINRKVLRKGHYHIRWKGDGESKNFKLGLRKPRTFLLQPEALEL